MIRVSGLHMLCTAVVETWWAACVKFGTLNRLNYSVIFIIHT
jgi:hypothetical protein